MYRCISTYPFITVLSLLLPRIITLFLHLLSTNHKCTQPCYFPQLLKPATQKERMDWNSSTRCSRLRVAPVVVPMVLWSLPLFHRAKSHHSLRDTTYVIIILYSWHLVICEHFWPYVWNYWSWVMHMMSTWFWHKNRVWQQASVGMKGADTWARTERGRAPADKRDHQKFRFFLHEIF
jgi:hypothetical protein